MFCTRCATFNPPDTALCGGCGLRLDWPNARTADSDRRRWFLLLPFALAFGVMAVVGWRAWETQQTQSAAYEHALAALDAGNLPVAIKQFGAAGGYRDAREQRITTQQLLAPYQAALLDAQVALSEGESEQAVALLRSVVSAMPDNVDAAALLTTAEAQFEVDLERSITVATNQRDWLAVERTMLQLAAVSGEPPDALALAELQRTHAPILFTRNGALFQVGPDGADGALLLDEVPVSAPLWSPDRSQIAFFSAIPEADRYAALFVVDADGSNLRLIDETAVRSLPAWSPDGTQLAYMRPAADSSGDATTTLRIVTIEGRQARDLALPERFTGALSPSWSGDGTRLALIGVGSNGTNELLLVDVTTLEATPALAETPANARAVSWSPSADMLLLWTTGGDSDWYALRGSTVFLIGLDDGSIVPVTAESQAPSRPVWAPDGVQYAYLERGMTLHVRVRTGIGERTIALPSKGNGMISWAPGGVGIVAPALDLAEPSMIVAVGQRLGPVELLALRFEEGWPATDFLWAPYTAPDPALYDPFAPVDPAG